MKRKDKELEKYNKKDVEQANDNPVFLPAVDIYEKNDSILVRCDMPGVEESQVNVTLENNELTITGTQTASNPEGYKLLSGEYNTGIFKRTFKIPQKINREAITAKLNDGVLDITLPKAEQEKPRKIEITTGG
jgi:HSP20 family protein